MQERQRSLEQALEEAVSRALRDNLAPLQRTADELHQAYADLVAACSSRCPSNALPAMLRAQTAASALAAGLSVLSNFVVVALKPRQPDDADDQPNTRASTVAVAEVDEQAPAAVPRETPGAPHYAELETESEWAENESLDPVVVGSHAAELEPPKVSHHEIPLPPTVSELEMPVAEAADAKPVFDVSSLSSDLQDLHRRANRVAKVAMQDIKLLQPKDVRIARENKDICTRLRTDLDKARKEYDRRFRAIQDHPVDYFHHWLVEILAEGDTNALGEYPYPSPVLRH